MRKSARILGQEHGLNAQEMNHILRDQGFLAGEPGDYYVTEKGAPFADETYNHRGTGGYAQYNPHWTTRTWDDSIIDALDLTEDVISEARSAVSQANKQRWAKIKAEREEADAAFLARRALEQSDNDGGTDDSDGSSGAGAALLIGGLIVAAYGIYKAVPHVANWWRNRSSKDQNKKITAPKGKKRRMPCPACGDIMILNEDSMVWECQKCTYSISHQDLENGAVFWFCDNCETFMNTQEGFTTKSGSWVCTKCGFDNDVTAANIIDE